jgi:hypothetical protein
MPGTLTLLVSVFAAEASATVGTWRSLVARTLGVREVAGSNPVVPTIFIAVNAHLVGKSLWLLDN